MKNGRDTDYKSLFTTAADPALPDEVSQNKTFAAIENTIKAAPGARARGVHPFRLARYVPALGTAAAALVVLPLIIYFALQAALPWSVSRYPFVIASGGGAVSADGVQRQEGDTLRECDRITTGPGQTCDISINDIAMLRFFPETSAAFSGYTEFSREIAISIESGALYVNKVRPTGLDQSLDVRIDDYRFRMIGTRVLLEKTDAGSRAICFEGRVTVEGEKDGKIRTILTLSAGEKISFHTIGEDIARPVFTLEFPSETETEIDVKLRGELVPGTHHDRRRASTSDTTGDHSRDDSTGTTTRAALPDGNRKRPLTDRFTVKELGRIPTSPAPGKTGFFSLAPLGSGVLILTAKNLYRWHDGVLDEPVRFTDAGTFTAGPVIAGGKIVIAETRAIHIIEKESFRIERTIRLDPGDAIEDNYGPRASGTTLYVPVKNRGYIAFELSDATSIPRTVLNEEFPVSPCFDDAANVVFIGSFYENYIAAMRADATEWKTRLDGKSFSNFTFHNRVLYAYINETGVPKIIEMAAHGMRTREWKLDAETSSDIVAYGHTIAGIYSDGRLFILDTRSSRAPKHFPLFSRRLPTRALRYLVPAVLRETMCAGTDTGELVTFDIERNGEAERVRIKTDEKFFNAPAVSGATAYIVSESGALFSIEMR